MKKKDSEKWTRKDEAWFRQFIKNAADREANQIMEQVNSDPALRDVQAPPEIRKKLFAQIREHEMQKEGSR